MAGSVPGALTAGPFTGVNFNAALGTAKKETVLNAIETWGNAVQKTLWAALVTHKTGGRSGPAPAQHRTSAWQTGGVHCAVYLKDGEGTALAGSTSAEFHITKVPCDGWFAERMMSWWGSLAIPEDFTAHIYTYQDEQGGLHVYELHEDAILNVGTWSLT